VNGREKKALCVIGLMLAGLLVLAPSPAPASECTPGQDGCLPTPQQCATGEYTGYWDGGKPGRLALCVGAAGHVAFYAGGTASPLCGALVVADQPVAGDPAADPNACGAGWGDAYDTTHVTITAHDGIPLDGWVVRPKGATEPLPTVLVASPYWGQQGGNGSSTIAYWSVPFVELLDRGYAVALVNVRGTGNSGGCFEMNGADEQLDQADTVNWLAAQPWSNGKVGMVGLSYDGTTPWGAAINAPAALKTIVVSGSITDRYLRWHTPQGLTYPELISTLTPTDPAFPEYIVHQSFLPPVLGAPGQPDYWLIDHAPVLAERVCPEVAKALAIRNITGLQEDRDPEFWAERRLIDRFDEIRASVLVAHGLQDAYQHSWHEDEVWRALTKAPKRILTGQWGHSFPDANDVHPKWSMPDWNDRLIAWLDAWLKGDGATAPGVGAVEYQDDAGAWRATTAWPPANARDEVLYLGGDRLSPAPTGESRTYRSSPNRLNNLRGFSQQETLHHSTIASALCPDPATTALATNGLVYAAEPAASDVVIAGNPFAFLRLTSDQPGGIFSVALMDLGPRFDCDAVGRPTDVAEVALGGADLRFHRGNMIAEPFPTGVPTSIRVDFPNLAHVLEPGHRLAVVIGAAGDGTVRWGQSWWTPELTFRADGGALASHVVLPVVSGTLGGATPTLAYPPKPFAPAA
jgi:predicted acyl esterase